VLAEELATVAPRPAPSDRPRGAILLAEDNPTNQAIARLFLEQAGHALTVVQNGEEVLAACRNRRFDLILMDLQMPIMDGREATRVIRESGPPNADTPILAMTASVEMGTRQACLAEGMNDVLTKPIRRDPFLAAVSRWLRRSSPESEDNGATAAGEDTPEA